MSDNFTAETSLLRSRSKRKKPGPRPRDVVEFPEPLTITWEEPGLFHLALDLHMRRHGDTCAGLLRAVMKRGDNLNYKTVVDWRRGTKSPRAIESLKILDRIEKRYRLPIGYFKAKLPHPARSAVGHRVANVGAAERRRIAWHLPDDYNSRCAAEKEEILVWVRKVIVTGSTEYRQFQANAIRQRYAVRFSSLADCRDWSKKNDSNSEVNDGDSIDSDKNCSTRVIEAPAHLAAEMADLLKFKTSTLTAVGLQRVGVWGEATVRQKIEHLGLMFGALVASPKSAVRGFGIPLQNLTFGLLIFPSVWDWYLNWRERRRGFYTAWEVDMLRVALALTRDDTGWLRQHPQLATSLVPVKGLVTQRDVAVVRADWNAACGAFHRHATSRVKEIQRVARVHRDSFEPILPILEAESPLAEYRKITDEILRLMPDEARFPIAAAEAVRSYLLLRIGMHTGLRQRNLRQLLLCPRGETGRSERSLADLRCGELRWADRDNGWEVFIPSIAFKNANSSYFGNKPFRLRLPDLGGLYQFIDNYIGHHRRVLLRNAVDPGTFFIKTMKSSSKGAAYDQNTFYEAWRLTIQRYGIFNPYTGRGAIKGLLPHGPHNIRDVLATHILKRTGSYEQASYAIQDTPDMVAKHYGRFLPQDKAALAAQILNKVWEAT